MVYTQHVPDGRMLVLLNTNDLGRRVYVVYVGPGIGIGDRIRLTAVNDPAYFHALADGDSRDDILSLRELRARGVHTMRYPFVRAYVDGDELIASDDQWEVVTPVEPAVEPAVAALVPCARPRTRLRAWASTAAPGSPPTEGGKQRAGRLRRICEPGQSAAPAQQ